MIYANDAKNELASLISKRNKSLFMMTDTQNLVASTVTAREYSYPSSVLNNLFTVELALDTSDATVFVFCEPYPGGFARLSREINGITELKITNNFDNTNPRYVKTRNGIYILSGTIAATTNGLKIRYRLYPADLATADLSGSTDLSVDPSTTTFGMPKQFHDLWVRRTSIGWKGDHPGAVPLSPLEQRYDKDLEDQLVAIQEDDFAEDFVFGVAKNDGSDY